MREAVDALFVAAALLVVLGFVPAEVPRRRVVLGVLAVVAVFALFELRDIRSRIAAVAHAPPPEPAAPARQPVRSACPASLRPEPGTATGYVDELRVAGAAQPLADGAEIARGAELAFSGWLAGFAPGAPADAACLVVDGRVATAAVATYGGSRPDVARALAAPRLAASGYGVRFSTAALRPGPHRFAVVAVSGSRYRPLRTVVTLRVR